MPGVLDVMKCKGRALASLQKESLQNISPTFPAIGKVEEIIQRIVPMSTFVGGFPFASSGFNDGTGYYFAKDNSGGLIIVDTWKRGGDRTNSNMVIMGVAGVGKSTAVKHIALAEYMKGTKLTLTSSSTVRPCSTSPATRSSWAPTARTSWKPRSCTT